MVIACLLFRYHYGDNNDRGWREMVKLLRYATVGVRVSVNIFWCCWALLSVVVLCEYR